MGWRFRKSFSPVPGIRLNFSPRGISTSVGAGPLRLYLGKQGAAVTTHIPGSGISYRQKIGSAGSNANRTIHPQFQPDVADPRIPDAAPDNEIRSADTETLTSEGLETVKEILIRAQAERSSLLPELAQTVKDTQRLTNKHERWTNGWLFKRIFKARFHRLGDMSSEAVEKEAELREQESLSRMTTDFELSENVKRSYFRLCQAVKMLSGSQRIWDTLSSQPTDPSRERTTATRAITRTPITISLGSCDLIKCPWMIPHLRHANGGEMFIYPAFILYRVSTETFALVSIFDADITYRDAPFVEQEAVPTDSKVIGQTWKKANKDGSPDRRFANNYQIPMVAYGNILISSKSGLNEAYLVSNAPLAEEFAKKWESFKELLPRSTA